MTEIWNGISEAQATIIAALITVLAAVVGVWLGSVLFAGRVRSLEDAIEKAEALLQAHQSSVDAKLIAIAARFESFDAMVSAMLQQVNTLGSAFNDLEASRTAAQLQLDPQTTEEIDSRESLKSNWIKIRDRVEEIASSPDIDGRRRARYGRIDRRMFYNLLDALTHDGYLGRDGDEYHEALELWHRYRNGRLTPSAEDVMRMENLSKKLG
ncbi:MULTISPECIES: hypothetical protein [unclassified Aureimonas]|uniref:hypothetical protein n=1 Tax=unclassified Aureimonas TaxID=2615206 RepID=UPI000AA4F895|nr:MULTISPECIES: hypothetical protein [unclassified Aureimonas]